MSKEQKNGLFTVNVGTGQTISYAIVDSRTIELYSNAQFKEILNKDKIVEISTGNFTLKIGDKFSHGLETIPSDYEIKYITKFNKRNYNHAYFLDTHPENRATVWVTPLIGLSREELGYDVTLRYNPYLVNAYLTEDNDKIGLLYRYSTHENYGLIEGNLVKSKQFVELSNKFPGFDLVILKVLPKFEKDIQLFRNGSYSKLSKEAKDRIVGFNGLKEKDKTYQILYKLDPLKARLEKELDISFTFAELDSKPDLKLEVIDI